MIKNSRPDLVWDNTAGQFGGWVPKASLPARQPPPEPDAGTVETKAALARMQWGRSGGWFSMFVGATAFDYRASAGDGRTNAAVMACVRFVQRSLPEAPLIVAIRNDKDEERPSPRHPLHALFERPNPHYSGLHLIGAIVADLMLSGNAYVIKVRSATGRVVQLWWVPSTLIEPRWDDDNPGVFISHYAYSVEGQVYEIDPRDVVQIRDYTTDPSNIRKGLSPLASLWREIATDNEAANWTGSLLRNGAVPGVIISPEGDAEPSEDDLQKVKSDFMQRFGGDERGSPLVMKGPTRVQVLSWAPKDMDLSAIRNVPEERITAVYGLPASVVGLGTGLEQTKVGATLETQERQAYKSCLIPMQRLIAAELQAQLMPDFDASGAARVKFDLSAVQVLQADQNALHERARLALTAGLVTLNEALQMIGREPVDGPEGQVRYVPTTVTVKTAETLIPDPAALPAAPPQGALPPAGDRSPPSDTTPAKGVPPVYTNGHANGNGMAAVLDAIAIETRRHERIEGGDHADR